MALADLEPLFLLGCQVALGRAPEVEPIEVEHRGPGGPLPGLLRLRPQAVVLDARLGGQPYAVDLVVPLVQRLPGIAVVVTVASPRPAGLVEVLEGGARALIDRQAAADELRAAVAAALAGRTWVSAPLASLLRTEIAAREAGVATAAMSGREAEVLRCLAQGRTNAEIGSMLGITENTVRNHVHAVMRKLGATTRTDAVAIALRRGLLDLAG